MTTLVAFDCGAGIILDGQTVAEVIEEHITFCASCLEGKILKLESQIEELKKRGYQARQKKWGARVDAALAEVKAHP